MDVKTDFVGVGGRACGADLHLLLIGVEQSEVFAEV
jgi:hypothetical protein